MNQSIEIASQLTASALQQVSLEDTLLLIGVEATKAGYDQLELMDAASSILLQSDNPDWQARALDYHAWRAEQFPDPAFADAIAEAVDVDQADGQPTFSQATIEELLAIAVSHFRAAAQSVTFAADVVFFDHFNLVADQINISASTELYRRAITMVAPIAIAAAEAGLPTDEEMLGGTLGRLALHTVTANPDISQKARSLIQPGNWANIYDSHVQNHQLAQAFLKNDYAAARAILHANKDLLIIETWETIEQQMMQYGDPFTLCWADTVLDFIYQEHPGYFKLCQNLNEDWAVLLFDSHAAMVIGLLDKQDYMDALVNPESLMVGRNSLLICNIANGLGIAGQMEGLNHLMERIPDHDVNLRNEALNAYIDASVYSLDTSGYPMSM